MAADPADRIRFQRIQELFCAAAALPQELRELHLAKECADDTSIRAQVLEMLRFDMCETGVLESPAFGEGVSASRLPDGDATNHAMPFQRPLPERIGRYRIIRVLGEGGMGTVYEAEQDNPRRSVAVKVLRNQAASIQALRRFEQEAQMLGRLQHPGIAQILEAGTTDAERGAWPFIAMEHVKGLPLLEFARERNLSRRERLELVARACDAMHYAHENGVVHRDLKPGNILVVEEGTEARRREGNKESAEHSLRAVPKILDFGVGRLIDSDAQGVTLRTTVGELIGTVPYMSPEQAAGDPAGLDWRSDVYSLGVILYELLTGRLPQEVRNLMIHEAVRVIREDDPTPAGSVNRSLRGDVETILAKALEKDKLRRYQSAADFAADIRRHLHEQPISARPASAMYRLTKFAKRNKAIVTGVAIAFLAMMAGTVFSTRQAIVAESARQQEEQQRRVADDRTAEAQWQQYRASLVAASSALRMHGVAEAERHLDAAPEHLRGWEWRHLHSRLDHSIARLKSGGTPVALAVSPDGRFVASANSAGYIRIWSATHAIDAALGEPPSPLAEHKLTGSVDQRRVSSFHFLPAPIPDGGNDGWHLRADAQKGSVLFALEENETPDSRGVVLTPVSHDDLPRYVRSHDGRLGVLSEPDSDSIVVRNLDSQHELLRLPRHQMTAQFSRDGRFLAMAMGPRDRDARPTRQQPDDLDEERMRGLVIVEFNDADAARIVCHRPDLKDVTAMSFNSDGSHVAVVSSRRSLISKIDTTGGHDVGTAVNFGAGHSSILDLAISPDDAHLAATFADGTVRLFRSSRSGRRRTEIRDDRAETPNAALYDEPAFELRSTMHGQRGQFSGLSFSPEGSFIVTGASDGTIRWWDATLELDPYILPAPATPYQLAFSADGARLAAACLGGERPLRIWDVETGREQLAALDGFASAAAFSTDGTTLAVGRSGRGGTSVIDASLGTTIVETQGHDWRTDWVAITDEGTLISLGNNGALFEYNLQTNEFVRQRKFRSNINGHGCRAAFSPDRSLLVVASGREVRFLDGNTWEPIEVVNAHSGLIYALAFSTDGAWLITGDSGGVLHAWDVATRTTVATMAGHSGEVFAAAWSSDGSRIFTGGRDGVIRVWDTQRFDEVTQLHGHSSLIYSLAFSPEGKLASGGGDAKIILWDQTQFRERLSAMLSSGAGE